MSSAEESHLFALIAVRALADYDPYEFRRATDLSKRELDDRINHLLELSQPFAEDSRARELLGRLDDLRSIEAGPESPVALSFFLRQLSSSSLERAYQLAVAYTQNPDTPTPVSSRAPSRAAPTDKSHREKAIDEFLRLGVMRLLRDLPSYTPRFGYRTRNIEIDCFLEPVDEGQPVVLIEGKQSLQSAADVQMAAATLKKAVAGWGRNAIVALLTTAIDADARLEWQRLHTGVYLLLFDSETNEFEPDDLKRFVEEVRARLARRK